MGHPNMELTLYSGVLPLTITGGVFFCGVLLETSPEQLPCFNGVRGVVLVLSSCVELGEKSPL